MCGLTKHQTVLLFTKLLSDKQRSAGIDHSEGISPSATLNVQGILLRLDLNVQFSKRQARQEQVLPPADPCWRHPDAHSLMLAVPSHGSDVWKHQTTVQERIDTQWGPGKGHCR